MQLMEAQQAQLGPVGTKILEFKSCKTKRQFTRKSSFSGRRFAKNPVLLYDAVFYHHAARRRLGVHAHRDRPFVHVVRTHDDGPNDGHLRQHRQGQLLRARARLCRYWIGPLCTLLTMAVCTHRRMRRHSPSPRSFRSAR